jgi:acyl-CoA:acyl-CoA alkyltransferase
VHIDAVEVAFPSRTLDNDQIVELVRQQSQGSFQGDLDQALALITKFLQASGAKSRRWLAEGETPIALIESAVRGALAGAGLDKRDVDLLIYVGVGKGFLEPAQSYLVAHALGMDRVECFDILDACMSWTRAMHVADGFLQMKRYRRIMIVNGEFNLSEGGPIFPCNYRLRSSEQIPWTFASYTIGSAATATIVSADNDNPWAWRFSSRPDLADLCTVPSFGPDLFSNGAEKIGKNGAFRFTSFGKELHAHALAPLVDLMRQILADHGEIKRIFSHASSFREWDQFARELGIQEKIHHVYPEYGNLVSASVPAGIATAVMKGLVQRGDRVAGWVGSAGMSFSAYSFRY